MRVIGKILASAAALAFVAGMTAASAMPLGTLSTSDLLSPVADKKVDDKKVTAEKKAPAIEKKAPVIEKKAVATEKKAVEKKVDVKKAAAPVKKAHKKAVKKSHHKKVAKKAAKKVAVKKAGKKHGTCGEGKYRKGGKCLSAADKK